jgi:TPP-dependent pyruvate/acetoin dehydrogenase alpha subunit
MNAARDDSLPALYRSLYRIRRVEEKIIDVYPSDRVKSPVHLSIGQESVSVGVCAALAPDDIAFGTYRGHALYLAKGGDLKRMIAELYGKVDGASRGKAGSMHLIDLSANMMGTSAIVATTIPQAVGYAFALKTRQAKQIVVCFFGEGAMDEGVCYESLNFAALKKLPILFICENNHYAIYSHIRERMPHPDPCERAAVFRIPNERIEGGDTLKIRDASQKAVAKVRAGEGPQFIECMTYRWRDHVGPDEDRKWKYRADEELDDWIRRDELKRLGEMLDAGERQQIEAAADAEIAAAFDYAEVSVFPGPEELATNVFAL